MFNTRTQRRVSPGFTLVELLLSLTLMSILMSVMMLSVSFATRALPATGTPQQDVRTAGELVDRIAADLALATSFVLADADTLRFQVPDRGHGGAGPENMRYDWSGTPGDPLTYRYNGCPDITLCEDVQDFSLEYVWEAMPLSGAPRVLMMVADDFVLTPQETAKQQLIESWGFSVQTQFAAAMEAEILAAAKEADVIYIPMDVSSSGLDTRIRDLRLGIILEERAWIPGLGIAKASNWNWADLVTIQDNTHEITSGFPVGDLVLLKTGGYFNYGTNPAAGGKILVRSFGYDMLIVLDAGDELYGGGYAVGRRVLLPWGDRDFDINIVNDDGLTLMRRAFVWAAAPCGIGSVRITLQVGSDPSGLAETQVQLLNVPEVQ